MKINVVDDLSIVSDPFINIPLNRIGRGRWDGRGLTGGGAGISGKMIKAFPKLPASFIGCIAANSCRTGWDSGLASCYGIAILPDDKSNLDERVVDFMDGIKSTGGRWKCHKRFNSSVRLAETRIPP